MRTLSKGTRDIKEAVDVIKGYLGNGVAEDCYRMYENEANRDLEISREWSKSGLRDIWETEQLRTKGYMGNGAAED